MHVSQGINKRIRQGGSLRLGNPGQCVFTAKEWSALRKAHHIEQGSCYRQILTKTDRFGYGKPLWSESGD